MFGIPSGVRAVTADETWRSVLAEAAHSTVHATVESAFEHALNLEVNGKQFTLLTDSGRPAPGALLTQRRHFTGVQAGARITVRHGVIDFGSGAEAAHPIVLRGITFFDCRVAPLEGNSLGNWEGDDPGRGNRDPFAMLAAVAVPGSFVHGPHQLPFERAVATKLQTARAAFSEALAAHMRYPRIPTGLELHRAITSLVGLGIGLTPSGDDYLVGALATLSLHPAAEDARFTVATALREILLSPGGPERTTAVSLHALTAATDRGFHHDLAAAARALLTADAPAAGAAFAATAAIGSTSGTDALFGLVDAYVSLLTPEPRALAHEIESSFHD